MQYTKLSIGYGDAFLYFSYIHLSRKASSFILPILFTEEIK